MDVESTPNQGLPMLGGLLAVILLWALALAITF